MTVRRYKSPAGTMFWRRRFWRDKYVDVIFLDDDRISAKTYNYVTFASNYKNDSVNAGIGDLKFAMIFKSEFHRSLTGGSKQGNR